MIVSKSFENWFEETEGLPLIVVSLAMPSPCRESILRSRPFFAALFIHIPIMRMSIRRCTTFVARLFSTQPATVQLAGGKDYYWCTCSKSLKQVSSIRFCFAASHIHPSILSAFLRRKAQRQRYEVPEIQLANGRNQILVCLQAHQEPTVLRRLTLKYRGPFIQRAEVVWS
jgi:hypothetical protein